MVGDRSISHILQVDERIRPALPVEWRAACAPEPHFLIEADCLTVLFIDDGRHFWMKRKAMAHERRADPSPATSWIDEQGLHVSVVDEHEREWVILSIHGKPERCLGKKALRANKWTGSISGGRA